MNTQNGNGAALATIDSAQEVVPRPAERTRSIANHRGLQLTTMREMMDFANAVAVSGLAPKGLETQLKLFVAVAMGAELGLSPMQSIQNIGVINGRPGPYGDAVLGLVRASGAMADFEEWLEDENGNLIEFIPKNPNEGVCAGCSSRRHDQKNPRITRFSVSDAKTANVWGKQGPWQQYPARMLMFRARGFNLRDQFPEVLKGVKIFEELADYPEPGYETAAASPSEPPVGRHKARPAAIIDAAPADAEETEAPAEREYSGPEAEAQSGAPSEEERRAIFEQEKRDAEPYN